MVFSEMNFIEIGLPNKGKIGKKVIAEIKKRIKIEFIGLIYCPIILALVHEIPQLTIAIIRKNIKRESFLLFTSLLNKLI